MGRPYADDLRHAALRLIDDGHTREEAAQLCGVSLGSIGRFIRRFRTTGNVSPDKFGGYKGFAVATHADPDEARRCRPSWGCHKNDLKR
jgi:transposase